MLRLRRPRARRGRFLPRLAALSLALLMLTGCSTTQVIDVGQPSETAAPELTRYTATFLRTSSTRSPPSWATPKASEEEFTAVAESVKAGPQEYHELYDIYNDYEGVSNIKTINDDGGRRARGGGRAHHRPARCSARDMCEATGGKLERRDGRRR